MREHQESRDAISRSLINDLEHYRIRLEEVNKAIENLLPEFNGTLTTMPGIDMITAADILSEIGEIARFPRANKLAKLAKIAYKGLVVYDLAVLRLTKLPIVVHDSIVLK